MERHSFAYLPRRSELGQAMVLFALTATVVIALVGFAVDYGRILYTRRVLQNTSDIAAAAGAMDIGEAGKDPIAKAREYSSEPVKKNVRANIPGVAMSAVVKCTNFMAQQMTGLNCTSSTTPPNTIVVTQTVTVPMTFARVLGFRTALVTTTATATMRGGSMPPLDVNIVLDTTNSMEGTPIAQAKAGIQTLLGIMWPCQQGAANCSGQPAIDRVGLYVFPGLQDATSVGREYDCSGDNPVVVPYGSNPIYQVIPMTIDYRVSVGTTTLNATSNLANAVGAGGGCTQGLEIIGGQGSYFASPIAAAQANLVANARANVQRVIIFVSDGDANEYTGGPTDPCQQAVTAAQVAAAATPKTWVYSIGYGIPGNTTPAAQASKSSGSYNEGCQQDPGTIDALQTMQRINSDYPQLTKFFNVPSSTSLTATFRKIGTDLLNTRLIDDDTP